MEKKPITILLIEDNTDDAFLIETYLSDAGNIEYQLKQANRLSSGVEQIKKGDFDIVLLDLGLPDAALGLEAFEKVHAEAPDIPIIVMTGYDNDEAAIEAVHKGAQDYLVKGQVSGGLLVRSIRYSIERQKLLTQLEHSAKEIKTLRGFLPICANCKKIRDDKGYWTQIETYISTRTEAEFSHGICPECALKLYGKILS